MTHVEERRLFERVLLLEQQTAWLRDKLLAVTRAAVAHAGDTVAHPCSENGALRILRTIVDPSPSEGDPP